MPGEVVMMGEDAEKWRELCAQAANEKDPEKLRELAQEINRLLKLREERASGVRTGTMASSGDGE